jgi:hypothetical protein
LLFQVQQSLFGSGTFTPSLLCCLRPAPFPITTLPPQSRKQRGSCNHRLTQTLCGRVNLSIKLGDHAERRLETPSPSPPLPPGQGHDPSFLEKAQRSLRLRSRPTEQSRTAEQQLQNTHPVVECDRASRAATVHTLCSINSCKHPSPFPAAPARY